MWTSADCLLLSSLLLGPSHLSSLLPHLVALLQWMGYQMSSGRAIFLPMGPQTHNQLIPQYDDKSLCSYPVAQFTSEVKTNLVFFLQSTVSIPISKGPWPLYGHSGHPVYNFNPLPQYFTFPSPYYFS